jgi:hypothetical protein
LPIGCLALVAKIFPFSPDPNHFYIPRRLTPHEGRIAIVTDAGWDAVDAAALARDGVAGRFTVSDHRASKTNGAEADGEVVWS